MTRQVAGIMIGLVALALAGWSVPRYYMYLIEGLGIEIPLPDRFVKAYPRIALGIFFIAVPVLVLFLAGVSVALVLIDSR